MAERTTDAGSSAPLSVGGARRASRTRTSRDKALETELTRIEQQGGDGTLRLADDVVLDVGNLDKLYFKAAGRSKGDVMRYYVRVGRVLVPSPFAEAVILTASTASPSFSTRRRTRCRPGCGSSAFPPPTVGS